MSKDIRLIWDEDLAECDFSFDSENQDLDSDEGIETAVIISIFTDRRARIDDPLPDSNNPNRRGWWGDLTLDIEGDQVGSRLWLLEREKTTEDVLVRAREYVEEALKWLIEDEVASKVDVNVEKIGPFSQYGLAIHVQVYKPDGTVIPLKYESQWAAQRYDPAAREPVIIDPYGANTVPDSSFEVFTGAAKDSGEYVDFTNWSLAIGWNYLADERQNWDEFILTEFGNPDNHLLWLADPQPNGFLAVSDIPAGSPGSTALKMAYNGGINVPAFHGSCATDQLAGKFNLNFWYKTDGVVDIQYHVDVRAGTGDVAWTPTGNKVLSWTEFSLDFDVSAHAYMVVHFRVYPNTGTAGIIHMDDVKLRRVLR